MNAMKSYKETCYAKFVSETTAFIIMKRQGEYEKVVAELKAKTDLITIEDWEKYVEERRTTVLQEDKKTTDFRGGRKPHYQGKKASPEKAPPEKVEEQPRPQPQTYQAQYSNGQLPMYSYIVQSAPQGYPYPYQNFPRPSQ